MVVCARGGLVAWCLAGWVGGCTSRSRVLINLVQHFALGRAQQPDLVNGRIYQDNRLIGSRIHYPYPPGGWGVGLRPTCQRCLWLTVSCNWLWWIYCCQFDKSMQQLAVHRRRSLGRSVLNSRRVNWKIIEDWELRGRARGMQIRPGDDA